MTTRITPCLTALALIAALAIPSHVTAQPQKAASYPYIAINLGELGGPASGICLGHQVLTNGVLYITTPDTAITDADIAKINPYFSPNTSDDTSIQHAALWRHGVLTDLGALPGTNSSADCDVNARGDGAGASEVGTIDPLKRYTELRAVLFKNGHVTNLGALGGNESFAWAINSRDQVVGTAAKSTADPWNLQGNGAPPYPWGTQTRGVLWQKGVLHNLGTLGGPDSLAYAVNERGQVAGASFTNAITNAVTGQPTEDPFLWTQGHLRDLGTLGGALGFPAAMNNAGEVAGQSNLAGDQEFHPFLWNGHKMLDLGTFGGPTGTANAIDQAGDVVGWATTKDGSAHAFLWKNGVLTDLNKATTWQCNIAFGINARGQVVGSSSTSFTPPSSAQPQAWCDGHSTGWLWDHGVMRDLNTLVAPSTVWFGQAFSINDLGEIALPGTFGDEITHMILLVPSSLAAREGLKSNIPAN